MCLLYGLLELGYLQLILCHLNHQLRGMEASADERFISYQAQRLGIPLEMALARTKQFASDQGLCIEMAGRELRYIFFAEVAKETHCSTILLAHHADDQLETCLINFLRGTGVAGLAGMRRESIRKIKKGNGGTLRVIRPMLKLLRSEIAQFTFERKIPFREDSSNQDTHLIRNRIRHELLPFLDQKFGITYRRSILRCAEILADEEDWMRKITEEFSYEAQLDYKKIHAIPKALQRRIVRRWLIKEHAISDVGFSEVERIRSLIMRPYSGRPAKVNLPARAYVRRRSGVLFLEKPKQYSPKLHTPYSQINFITRN